MSLVDTDGGPIGILISIRLSRDVLSRFRDSGDGWQGRVDKALRDWLKRHSPGARAVTWAAG
jgi:uncharacterized protein (DUF4415 family)